MNHEKLYKIDTKGKTRVWWMESTDTSYRTCSGINGGKIVVSGWRTPEQKNVGRSNETSVSEQVLSEVRSAYDQQTAQGGYTAGTPARSSRYFEPMLAKKYEAKKVVFPIASQPKLDGIRCIVTQNGMASRNGKPIVSSPHILYALEDFFQEYPDVILDGELYNHDFKDNFEKIVSLARKMKPNIDDFAEAAKHVQFHVYDMVDTRSPNMSFIDRATCISNWFVRDYLTHPVIQPVNTVVADCHDQLDSTYSKYLADGFEGQMLRVLDSPYENKRSKNLVKRKEFFDEEFTIVDVTEGIGNWGGYAKSVVIRLADGEIQESGVRGNQEFLKDILENKETIIGTDATIRYQGRTAYGKLRFPIVVHFWRQKRDM